MAYIQQPISRHISGDTTMAGRTTMIPQASFANAEIQKQQAYDIHRQYALRYHALAPRTVQAGIGYRGDNDNGHRYEVPSASSHASVINPRTFGTPNLKRSMIENIQNTIAADSGVLHKMGRDKASLGGSIRTRAQDAARKEECAKRARLMGQCRTYKGPEKLQKRVVGSVGRGIRLGGNPSTYTPR